MADYILSNSSLAVRVTLLLLHVQHVLYDKVMWQMILIYASTEITNNDTVVVPRLLTTTLVEYTYHVYLITHKCSPAHCIFALPDHMPFPMMNKRE